MSSLPDLYKAKQDDIKCSGLFLEKKSPYAFEMKRILFLPAKDAWN